jgi:hypothetical protein
MGCTHHVCDSGTMGPAWLPGIHVAGLQHLAVTVTSPRGASSGPHLTGSDLPLGT